MHTFAKLFDTPHGQCLVTKERSDDDDSYQVAFRGVGNEVASPTLSFSYGSLEERDQAFDSMGQEDADKIAAEMDAVVNGMFAPKQDD